MSSYQVIAFMAAEGENALWLVDSKAHLRLGKGLDNGNNEPMFFIGW